KLVLNEQSVGVTLTGNKTDIKNGVDFRGNYAEFSGEGFANTEVTINPKSGEAIIDFKGTAVEKVIINDKFKGKVAEIRGAENIGEIEFGKGVDEASIKITDSNGVPIGSPPASLPELIQVIPDQTVNKGETITLQLNDYFEEPNGKSLAYTSTLGEINPDTAELTLALDAGDYIVGVTAENEVGDVTARFSVKVIEEDDENPIDPYYADAYGKKGAALKAALHEII